jgi:L-serine dehydratase
MDPISLSFFDLFKIGPGPSSSHTIGPMKAGFHFLELLNNLDEARLKKATHVEVTLYGSLSATGRGHGTERAVTAGLLGWQPETCDAEELLRLFSSTEDVYLICAKAFSFPFEKKNIIFGSIYHSFPFSNTMVIALKAQEEVLLEREYYSLGGGFLHYKGEEKKELCIPRYPYSNMRELKRVLEMSGMPLYELLMQNEESLTSKSRKEIETELDRILAVMEAAVVRGINAWGVLPGPIKLEKRAATLHHIAESKLLDVPDRFLILLDAYSLAAAEENASGHIVVTAPTSGSSGVIPGILYLLKHYFKTSQEDLRRGLVVSACIGFIAKHNASISGAEVGCQGEIGVASSMGAAFVGAVDMGSIHGIEMAAEIALEHGLGLTCDPVGGYVQIPCVERNAVGAVNAYNAYLLAASSDPKKKKISFDEVIRVMYETGRDMCSKYKETSKGGLATCHIFC